MNRMPALFMVFFVVQGIFSSAAISAGNGKESHRAGITALKAGHSQEAISLFSQAIRENPQDHRYYNDRGVAYKVSGDLEKAESDYTTALQINPDFVNALNNRGVVYLNQGAYDKAIADFNEALKLGGLEEKVYMNRGLVYARKGEHRKAIQDFSKAISLGPTSFGVYLLMGQSLEQVGSSDQALKMYELALGLTKDQRILDEIEKKIAHLEKGKPSVTKPSQSSAGHSPALNDRGSRQLAKSNQRAGKKPRQRSGIVRAQPLGAASRSSADNAVQQDTTEIGNPKDLYLKTRTKALKKLSSGSEDVYLQGRNFLAKNHTTKALIRFQDTRQLEKRQRNEYGIAWSDLEIGRVLSKMGDHHRAASYLVEAVRMFERLKAADESLLALIELGTNQRSIARDDRTSALFRVAAQKAVSQGYYSLARSIGTLSTQPERAETAQKTVAQPRVTTATPSSPRADRRQSGVRRTVAAAAQGNGLAKVGRGPIDGTTAGKRKTGRILELKKELAGAALEKHRREKIEPQPERVVFWAKGAAPRKKKDSAGGRGSSGEKRPKKFQRDLAELRKLRAQNDERGMIVVLERLSKRYMANQDFEKALHCLDASLGFRENLRSSEGKANALRQRGNIKEELGQRADALEDITKAMSMGRDMPKVEQNALRAYAQRLAAGMRLDEKEVMEAFNALWRSRGQGDGHGETRALHRLGQLYDKAGHGEDALRYYERSSASMLNDKARSYGRMGQEDLAKKSYEQALEAFRKLDYSRYIDLKKKKTLPNTLSLH